MIYIFIASGIMVGAVCSAITIYVLISSGIWELKKRFRLWKRKRDYRRWWRW